MVKDRQRAWSAATGAVMLAGATVTGGAAAQSPLVVDPQVGATPRPLATPAPTPLPTNAPAPVIGPQAPSFRPVPVAPVPVELPAPTGDPLAIDPAADPVLRLARATTAPAAFRATIAAAVARNPAYDEALAVRAEALGARNEARARQLPVADLSFSSFKIISRQFSNDPQNLLERQRPDHRTDATARVQQLLVDFGASAYRINAANRRVEAAADGIEDAQAQLALRAVAVWYAVYDGRALVQLAQGFAANQRSLRGALELRVRQGVAAPGDLAQIDGYIASADSQLADLRRALASAEAQFEAATGSPAPADLGRAPPPDPDPVLGTASDRAYLPLSVENLPAVRAARAGAAASRKDAAALRADLIPQVSVGIDAGRYGVFETANDYDIRGSATVSWRLGGGGAQRVQQANARADGATARAARVRDEALRDARIARADVDALIDAAAALEANYIASRRARDVLTERFRVSRGQLFDVVAADSNFFTVAARYLQTVTELDTARYTLLARTGRLLPALGIDPQARRLP